MLVKIVWFNGRRYIQLYLNTHILSAIAKETYLWVGVVRGFYLQSRCLHFRICDSICSLFVSRVFLSRMYLHSRSKIHKSLITINVPLFKKMRDIIFFCGTITFWAVSRDILRGPRLFWPLKLSRAQGSKKYLLFIWCGTYWYPPTPSPTSPHPTPPHPYSPSLQNNYKSTKPYKIHTGCGR